MEDIAYDLIDSGYNLKDIPSLIANNIDYDGIARDLEQDVSTGRLMKISL